MNILKNDYLKDKFDKFKNQMTENNGLISDSLGSTISRHSLLSKMMNFLDENEEDENNDKDEDENNNKNKTEDKEKSKEEESVFGELKNLYENVFPDDVKSKIESALNDWQINITGNNLSMIREHAFDWDLNYSAVFPFPSYPQLQLRVVPLFRIEINIKYGIKISINPEDLFDIDFQLIFEITLSFVIKVNLEAGVYIPSSGGKNCVNIVVGILGTIIDAKLGFNLNVHFIIKGGSNYQITINFDTSIFSALAYVKSQAKADIWIVKFDKTKYLFKENWDSGLCWRKARWYKFDLKSKLIDSKVLSGEIEEE
jgi:hypothetical protein